MGHIPMVVHTRPLWSYTTDFAGLVVLPLYSGLSRADQDLVFSPTPRGKRKVVISTNIAETSLTLEGIVYVVDSGFSKQRFYNPVSFISFFGYQILKFGCAPISKASARQRAGRAGRVRPGKCYRLYTEEYFVNEMSAHAIPEMQRSNLVSFEALGIDNILGFDWPASPSPEAMIRALEVLYSLGVLDDDAKLTSPLGFQVAEIPLDPMISKTILSSNQLGCSEEIITIAAILSVQSIWVSARGAQRELDEAKMRFAAAEYGNFFIQIRWGRNLHSKYFHSKSSLEVVIYSMEAYQNQLLNGAAFCARNVLVQMARVNEVMIVQGGQVER
ncbi:putative pre-mRNA-splicing factor ATP-dependent RNA helicase DEAH9 [Vitis vinifera]|uniref:RNA helicase n=1 Tax=Vitis vinifera TaxID=29760 RepID=A0A438D2G7_VITVI|nr:putative pre-mRNA-splicing factor ATP-dependent RNA helicase DEAH9 [Vitis vinifera]